MPNSKKPIENVVLLRTIFEFGDFNANKSAYINLPAIFDNAANYLIKSAEIRSRMVALRDIESRFDG